MSTIDNRQIIEDLLRRKGIDKHEGSTITLPSGAKCDSCGAQHYETRKLLLGERYTAATIIEYTTGFGGKAWKLFYSAYAGDPKMTTEKAEQRFFATANIKPGTACHYLLQNGELTDYGKEFLKAK